MASQTSLTGVAGEHYVLCELLRRGYIAALEPTGVPTADILVTDKERSRLREIQVKTRQSVKGDGSWTMDKKCEKIKRERLFYCFVDFGDSKVRPLVYVMPSAVVATAIAAAHKTWLDKPGKNGRHKDHRMRRLLPDFEKTLHVADDRYRAGWLDRYRDAWNLLKLDAPKHPIAKE